MPTIVTIEEATPAEMESLDASSPFHDGVVLASLVSALVLTWDAETQHDNGCPPAWRITVNLGHPEARILLLSEIATDPCRRHLAIAHERGHIAINEHSVARATPRLRQLVLEASGQSQEQQSLTTDIKGALESGLAELIAGRDADQRSHDRPAALRHLAERCP